MNSFSRSDALMNIQTTRTNPRICFVCTQYLYDTKREYQFFEDTKVHRNFKEDSYRPFHKFFFQIEN